MIRYSIFLAAVWVAKKVCVWGFTYDYLSQAEDNEREWRNYLKEKK